MRVLHLHKASQMAADPQDSMARCVDHSVEALVYMRREPIEKIQHPPPERSQGRRSSLPFCRSCRALARHSAGLARGRSTLARRPTLARSPNWALRASRPLRARTVPRGDICPRRAHAGRFEHRQAHILRESLRHHTVAVVFHGTVDEDGWTGG